VAINAVVFYNISLNIDNQFIVAALTFLQCWNLVLVGFLFFQTYKYVRFPDFAYRQLPFETPLYFKILGLNTFQFLLVNSFFRHLNPRVYLKGRTREYMKIYFEETRQSETSHWFSMAPTLVVQILFLYQGMLSYFLWLTAWTIIFNLYPLLLQRKNRFLLETKFPNLIGK
jgi:hypothetical protein